MATWTAIPLSTILQKGKKEEKNEWKKRNEDKTFPPFFSSNWKTHYIQLSNLSYKLKRPSIKQDFVAYEKKSAIFNLKDKNECHL